ncbi:copper amine oxidase N-terminal domain-containing protein [Desulfofalx alkaliphila]|uniref:copper amine oxidase N-terminal domain-containing protein n=1 Tax=Desulfofalx alkaliphila TaxID=105483 RepID=UPI0006904CA8|nr:copper amine oxidase N-terminal domain-containing protein [Desulfofalx alkaliphila]
MNFKRSKRTMAIMLAMVMMFSMLLPVSAFASGTEYRALLAPSVNDGEWGNVGSMLIKVDGGILDDSGNSVSLRLPADFEIGTEITVSGSTYSIKAGTDQRNSGITSGTDTVRITVPSNYAGDTNELSINDIEVQRLTQNEFMITVNAVSIAGENAFIRIDFPNVYVKNGYSGPVTVTASAPSNSAFTSGSVNLGSVVTGSDKVELAVTNTPTFSSEGTRDGDHVVIRVTEKKAGALEKGRDSLRLRLPSGFAWADADVNTIWGDEVKTDGTGDVKLTMNGIGDDELRIDMNKKTSKETTFELILAVEVDDETDAKVGEVTVQVRGKSDFSPSSLVIGSYGDYDVTISTKDVPTIYSGQVEQEVAEVVIKESVQKSLIDGRTITITLPSHARWGEIDSDSDAGVKLEFDGFTGTDGKTARWKVVGESNDAAELSLGDLEVVVQPGFSGDLVAEIGGTAGLKGEVVLANVIKPVTISASGVTNVAIGSVSKAGDLTITENDERAIKKDKDLIVELPQGVRYASTPKVEVTEGDLKIDTYGLTTRSLGGHDDRVLVIPIDSESTEASTIKITGIEYVVDRTVPEADISVSIKGAAVNEVNDRNEVEDYYRGTLKYESSDERVVDSSHSDRTVFRTTDGAIFPNNNTVDKAVNAKVTTPAQGDAGFAMFTVGSTIYNVDGTMRVMDAAPYIKNDRTYVPVRFLAYALGVDEDDVAYEGGVVTLTKGDTTVALTIGSNSIDVNGSVTTMDVAPEISNDRTMLPARFVAEAFGATVGFASGQVVIDMK